MGGKRTTISIVVRFLYALAGPGVWSLSSWMHVVGKDLRWRGRGGGGGTREDEHKLVVLQSETTHPSGKGRGRVCPALVVTLGFEPTSLK